jgi:V/A-type H+-transporting ATPase subunit I
MIVDVDKYLIFGAKEDLDIFFAKAQESCFLEFISISSKKQVDHPITVQSLLSAIKILKRMPFQEPYVGDGDLAFAMQIAERVIELKEDLEKLGEEKRVLAAEISRVAPFGDFSMDDIDYIEHEGHRKVQFFCMKTSKSHKTNFSDEIIYINTEYDLDYFITINRQTTNYPGMIEMHIDATLSELENRLSYVDDAIHRFEGELKEYAGYIDFLISVLTDELNKHSLSCAKKDVVYPMHNALFVIEAWVPQNKTESLFSLIDGMAIHAEPIIVGKNEKVPTCMENINTSLIGEDLVTIYDIPATSDKDPSNWVLWFFALFFAIIVSDGGYGLLFLGLAFYLKFKFPKIKGAQKRMLKLLFILASSCVLWGVATGSYFGLKLSSGNFLNKISPLHYLTEKKASYHIGRHDEVYCFWVDRIAYSVESEHAALKKDKIAREMLDEFSSNILMELTIIIAIIHLSCSFLRYVKRNFAGLGWVIFMVGAYLYCPSVIKATSLIHFMGWMTPELATAVGLQLLCGGIGFAVIAALIQRRLNGLSEIANVVQVFADVLSYLRLYALGLAGSIMAATFNEQGSSLHLVIGFVVILLGHSVNILLAFMGGVIHGLRLNFLEWYHYSFDGGGRLFKPLSKIKRSS